MFKKSIVFVLSIVIIMSSCNNFDTNSKNNETIEKIDVTKESDNNMNEKSNDVTSGNDLNLSDPGLKINEANKKILMMLESMVDGNIVYSNAGIQSVLAMADHAAMNDTKSQIESVNGTFDKRLNSEAVNIYNFMVLNEGRNDIKAKDSFTDTLKNEENIKAELYPMNGNPGDIAKEINKKVALETNQQIQNAVSEREYDNEDFIIQLGNVIHFLGTYEHSTKENPYKIKNYYFENISGEKVAKDFVVINENDGRLIENNDIIGLTLNYKEENLRYRFVIFTPKDEKNFSLDRINAENLNYFTGMRYKLNARFPKFEFDNDLDLTSILMSLGIKDLFNPMKADLSNGFEFNNALINVYANYCKQKSVIRVDEYGTEASAFTSMGLYTATAAPKNNKVKVRHVDLTFNRPFYFMIYDSVENMPLFIGEIVKFEDTGLTVNEKDKDVATIVDRIVEEDA